MSTHKTNIDQLAVKSFAESHLHLSGAEFESINGGESSQAYLYACDEGERVLRINAHSKNGFLKDSFAEEHFASERLPIPRILEVGEIQKGIFFAVSVRAIGNTLDKFSSAEIDGLVPQIINTLDAIHAVFPAGEGYGQWCEEGKGTHSTWREKLIADMSHNEESAKSARTHLKNKCYNLICWEER